MKRGSRWVWRALALCAAGLSAAGQTAGNAPATQAVQPPPPARETLAFDFANPALSPAAYRIEFDTTGAGHYHSEPGQGSPPAANGVLPTAFDQPIQISPPVREQLLAVAHSRRFLSGACEAAHNKVAFTGRKTLTYTGSAGQRTCTFNWSQDAQLMKIADTFLAISLTLEEGRRLRLFYLHDRLSLDAELETLTAAAKDGTALELQNIAPELEAIASDGAVMKRAQARAAALLASASPGAEAAAIQAR